MSNNIIPGILEKDWEEIERKILAVLPFTNTIHIDLIDGKFAPNATFLDPSPFSKYAKDVFFELHMMVDEPIDYLNSWAAAGFKRFIGHIEKMSDQVEFVAQGQLLGEVGLGIDGPTSETQIEVPLDDLDVLLFMTVKAGASGEKFVPEYLEKVKKIKEKMFIPIEVDGGINAETIRLAKDVGVSRFVSTHYIFQGSQPSIQYKGLEERIK